MRNRFTARIVPWATFSEWEQVRGWLFGQRIEGVRRVKAWASRGKVPAAVDATALFVEIAIRDAAGVVSEHELRLMYSMAFVRFVNGVVDTQQKGMYAASVAGIAESLGLPTWFVDLRHAGTHDRLPSIALLRAGCHQALDWLNANYWVVQTTYINNTASDVRELLVQFLDVSTKDSVAALARIKEIVGIILADNYRDFLIPCLLEPGFLVPDLKKTRSKYPELTLHAAVQSLWNEPLNIFESAWPGFVEDLLATIVGTAFIDPAKAGSIGTSAAGADEESERSPQHSMSYQATIAAWARHILKTRVLEAATDSTEDTIDAILEASLANPTIFTKHILSDIATGQPTIHARLQPFIAFIDGTFKTTILADRNSSTGRKRPAKQPSIFDAGNPEDELRLLRARVREIAAATSLAVAAEEGVTSKPAASLRRWRAAGELSWARVPVGHVPGIGLPDLDLGLQLDDVALARRCGLYLRCWLLHLMGTLIQFIFCAGRCACFTGCSTWWR
ncbi:Las1-like-domain-containing protein [Chytriomyces sp. MP71]|nr:Las1-like-domain-containing protein [Chytriomyces sp. MP71]